MRYTKEDEKRADELARNDRRFGDAGSPFHDYPGALEEARRERIRRTPLHQAMMRE